jgi:hypothetical protein
MNDAKYEKLYKWQKLTTDSEATDETCFIEFEKNMAEHGIRTRILPNEEGEGYTFWVPQKDFEIAHGLFTGDVKAVIDSQKELYHVFDTDLTFKNKVLYENKYKNLYGKNKYRTYIFTGVILVIMFLLARFVKF